MLMASPPAAATNSRAAGAAGRYADAAAAGQLNDYAGRRAGAAGGFPATGRGSSHQLNHLGSSSSFGAAGSLLQQHHHPAGQPFLQAAAGASAAAAAAGLGKPPGRPWFALLQDFLQAGGPSRVQCRQILAAAADAAAADAAAAAAGVGLLLGQLAALLQENQLGPADLVAAVRRLFSQVGALASLCNAGETSFVQCGSAG